MSDPALAAVRAAYVQARAGAAAPAAETLERLVRAGDLSQRARVEAHLALGEAYDALGRRRDAQACYRRAMSLTDDAAYRERARRGYRRGPGAGPYN